MELSFIVIGNIHRFSLYDENKYQIGFIELIICTESNEINLRYLHIKEHFRGKGYGLRLMADGLSHMMRTFPKIERYLVDDMTDRCTDASGNNIYEKVGFEYINAERMFNGSTWVWKLGGPERILNISKWREFIRTFY